MGCSGDKDETDGKRGKADRLIGGWISAGCVVASHNLKDSVVLDKKLEYLLCVCVEG